MRFAIYVLFFLAGCIGTVAAQNDASKVAVSTVMSPIELDNYDVSWWSNFEALNSDDKKVQLLAYQEAFNASLKKYELDSSAENPAIIEQLVKRIIEQLSKVSPSPLSFTPAANYTLDEWTQLIALIRSNERELSQLNSEINRFSNLTDEHAKNISTQLVEYKKLASGSLERKRLAVDVIRTQLEKILFVEKIRSLKVRQNDYEAILQQQRSQQKISVGQLTADTSKQVARIEKLQQLESHIADIKKSLYRLELNRLSYSDEKIQFKIRIEELELSAKLLSLNLDVQVLQQAIYIEDVLSKSPNPGLLPKKSLLSNYQIRKNKLTKQFEEIHEILNVNESSLSQAQPSQERQQLQKIRVLLQLIDNRIRDSEYLFTAIELIEEQYKTWWERRQSLMLEWSESALQWVRSIGDAKLVEINDTPITLLDLFWALLVIISAIFISNRIRKMLVRFSKGKANVSEAAVFTVGRIIHYVIIIVAVIIAFSTLGIDFSKLALVAGALSVGIGFGLQSIFNNFISGIILLFERPFKIGDLIELESGLRGRIKSINVRSTQINTWDNIDILVPNSEFISGRVTNYTFNDDLRRLHIPFGVAYGVDKNLVYKAAVEAALRVPYTITNIDQAPDVWLVNYGESSLDFELIVWIQTNHLPKRGNPKATYLWEIETSLAQYKIEIPFPQRDLHLRSVDENVFNQLNTAKLNSSLKDNQ